MNLLVISVGLMFVGSAVGAFLTQGTRTPLAIAILIIGLACCGVGAFWSRMQRVFGPAFVQSLTSTASDARTWLALAVVVWLFFSTLLFFRRTSEAQTTTAALQVEILTLKNDFSALRDDYKRFRTPRALTQKQFDDIADFLSTRDGQTITIAYFRGDREARQYAVNLENVLTKAGWNITMSEVDDASNGVYVENMNAHTASAYTKAAVLLKAAFKEANVELGDSVIGNGGPESTRLVVGPKKLL
jgi:hypothetical protein